MRITIDALDVTVERDDGQVLTFSLSDAGMTITTDTLILDVDETPAITLTVPFQAQGTT